LTSQANDLYQILEYKLDVIVLKKCLWAWSAFY